MTTPLCECRCPGEAKCPKPECRAGGCVVERRAVQAKEKKWITPDDPHGAFGAPGMMGG